MHPKVYAHYQAIAAKYQMQGPFLEIGTSSGPKSILAGEYFRGKPNRVGTNLGNRQMLDEADPVRYVRCNSNDMRAHFADGAFATVLSNAVIEHDRYFWRSIDEMKRVLAPGGLMAVGAPGYVPREGLKTELPAEIKNATAVLDVHMPPDYWRFSRQAFKEVICEGMEVLEIVAKLRVPVLIAVARKPMA